MDKYTLKNIKKCIGQTIKQIVVHDSIITIDFYPKKENYEFRLILKDQETICCENRYYTCDDDLNVDGEKLISIELEDGNMIETYDVHETKFLKIKTDKNTIIACSHNVNNGNYGGIDLVCFLYKGKVVPA